MLGLILTLNKYTFEFSQPKYAAKGSIIILDWWL